MNLNGDQTRLLAIDITDTTQLRLEAATNELNLTITKSTEIKPYKAQIETKTFQVIVLNLDETGLKNLVKLKRRSKTESVPVIMMDYESNHAKQLEAFKKGAFQIIQSENNKQQIKLIILSGLNSINNFHRLTLSIKDIQHSLTYLDQANFSFHTISEAQKLAQTLSFTCQESTKVAMGLTEILVNAVEHGNLELSYQDKTLHQANNTWQKELQKRQKLPKYKDKFVSVKVRRIDCMIEFTVMDQGKGFDFTKFMTIDPEKIDQSHGRGISIARLISFDQLEYESPGNKVIMSAKAAKNV